MFTNWFVTLLPKVAPCCLLGQSAKRKKSLRRKRHGANMPYVTERWLGGTLTNWETIKGRINHLLTLEKRRDNGEFDGLKKKELLMVEREIARLNLRLGGIRNLKELPNLLFIVDIVNEATAVKEANSSGIPIAAMVDTNCNPDPIEHVIPANDDAIRAIKLIVSKMADAAIEGANMRKDDVEEAVTDIDNYAYAEGELDLHDASDDQLLGASTLANLSGGEQK